MTAAPFYRVRDGESSQAYIERMREGYGDAWYIAVPICFAHGCNRKPVVSAKYGSSTVYYCDRHKRRPLSPEYWLPPLPVFAPFSCPSRKPTFPNRTRVQP